MSRPVLRALLAVAAIAAPPSSAVTVQTLGAGTAVTSVDRAAGFAALDHNGIAISDYTENGLFVGVSGDSRVDFDPFHGANGSDRTFHFPDGGSTEWTRIQTPDALTIYAVELMYGNGWTTGDVYGQYPWGNANAVLEWKTRKGGLDVSSGTVGPVPLLQMGTIVGFSDPAGFDTLLLRSTISTSADPSLQALALDNLRVQITPLVPRPAPPGDANGDGAADVLDVFHLINGLFAGGPSAPGCAADVDGSGQVDVLDVFFLINALFAQGGAPADPPDATLTFPISATAGASGLAASVAAQAGASYAWTVTGGSIAGGQGTPTLTFDAGNGASLRLDVTVTRGLCSATAHATVVLTP